MRLPGYLITSRRMRDRLKSEGWQYQDVTGRGPTGIERVYHPPQHVLVMIEAMRHGELRTEDARLALSRQSTAEPEATYQAFGGDLVDAAATRVGYAPPPLLHELLVIALLRGLEPSALDAMISLLKAQAILDHHQERSS